MVFQEKWIDKCFCVSVNGKALYLLCSECIAISIAYNTARHYNVKHKEKYKNCVCSEKKKVIALKRGLES
jgi:hypothetical protein